MSTSEPFGGSTRSLSDLGAVAMAGVAASAAWWSPAVPWWLALVVVLVAVVSRRTATLLVAVAVVAAFLGARAWQGDHPVPAGPFQARATLVSDPEEVAGAVVVEARALGHHYEIWARGGAGRVLDDRAAGESVRVVGHVSPRRPGDDIEARRHVVGEVAATDVQAVGDGGPPVAVANGVRRLLEGGGDSLPSERRALYRGFVLGDDRGESPVLAADFAASGLAHLLVVSGENVAFVLAAAAPLLRRLGPRTRWLATMAVLLLFAAVTRFEPSVLRATAMAMIAVTAWSLGRPASGLRILGLAVTAVVLLDPMLVGVPGFQLSVAASAGIVVLARPLARHLPLPDVLAGPLSVTLAAQVAVSPLLCLWWGGVPVATIPANLCAEPAAAALMVWGLTVGVLAGLVGGAAGAVLQLPADGLTWWVETVARVAADAPLGRLGALGIVLAAAAGVAAVAWARQGRVGRARLAWLVVVAVLAAPGAGAAIASQPRQATIAGGGTFWTSAGPGGGAVLVLSTGATVRSALDGLRRLGVDRIELLVSPSGGSTAATLLASLRRRVTVVAAWCGPGPDPLEPPCGGAGTTPPLGAVARIGDITVTVDSATPHLAVRVEVADAEPTGPDGTASAPGVGSPRAGVARSPPLRRDPPSPRHGHPQPHP
jgi:competence protein ComEC